MAETLSEARHNAVEPLVEAFQDFLDAHGPDAAKGALRGLEQILERWRADGVPFQ